MKFHSIRSKIIFLSSLCLLIIGTTIIAYAVIYIRDSAILRVNDQIRYIARDRADHVQLEIDKAMTNLHTLSLIMRKVKDPLDPMIIEREQVDILLQSVLNQNKKIAGVYTCWLPGAFDNKDKYYENEPGHDKTGRFSPYWYRNKYGIIDVEPFRHYDELGADNFFLVYKEMKQPFIADPHIHTIDGNDFLVVSLIEQVILKEAFYGIVGINLGLKALQNLTEKTRIGEEGGLIAILSAGGKIVGATGRQDLAGKDAYKIVEDIGQYNRKIGKGEEFTGYSKDNIEFFAPIKIANSNPWWVRVSVPNAIITAEARNLSKQLIFVGGVCIILSIFIFWLFSGSIVKSLNSLVKGVRQIGEGKYGQVVEGVDSQDEIGELASAFNNMSIEIKNREVERDKSQEARRESENKYRTLLENIPQKIFLKDVNLVYVSCNNNLARDLGIDSDKIRGATDDDFFPEELAEKYREDDRRIIKSGKTEGIEEKYIQDGKEIIVHTIKTPVKDKRGDVIGLLGIFWDITDSKQAEEELEKHREHLEELVKKRTSELEEKMAELERMNDLFVGRELRIKELRNRVKELEESKD